MCSMVMPIFLLVYPAGWLVSLQAWQLALLETLESGIVFLSWSHVIISGSIYSYYSMLLVIACQNMCWWLGSYFYLQRFWSHRGVSFLQSQCTATQAFCWYDSYSYFCWGACFVWTDCGYHSVLPCWPITGWLSRPSRPSFIISMANGMWPCPGGDLTTAFWHMRCISSGCCSCGRKRSQDWRHGLGLGWQFGFSRLFLYM